MGSGPETRPVRQPVKSSVLDHSLLWVLTTDQQPLGIGVWWGFHKRFPEHSREQ